MLMHCYCLTTHHHNLCRIGQLLLYNAAKERWVVVVFGHEQVFSPTTFFLSHLPFTELPKIFLSLQIYLSLKAANLKHGRDVLIIIDEGSRSVTNSAQNHVLCKLTYLCAVRGCVRLCVRTRVCVYSVYIRV